MKRNRSRRLCAEAPSCARLATVAFGGRWWCQQHALKAKEQATRRMRSGATADPAFRKATYKSRQWKKARDAWIAEEPLCRNCGRPGEVVDHLEEHRGDVDAFWRAVREGSLQTLCVRCHSRKGAASARASRHHRAGSS
jgi:5-methylcytosine-specific restriction endonuclease McrA